MNMESFVQFHNTSKQVLRGMIHRPPKRVKGRNIPGVVFFHGFTGDRMESHWLFVKCARALAEAGMASLRFDFYGSGESDGDFSEATLRGEISDARAAVEFFRQQPGIDPGRIALIGISLGGAIAASIASRVRAQALTLWAAVARLEELRALAQKIARPIPERSGFVEYNANVISLQFLDRIEKINPLREIARFRRPTLIIHGSQDDTVPPSAAEDYFQAAGSQTKERIIIPGADHTFASVLWERQVIERSVDWLRAFLVESPPSRGRFER
jgi:alpha/beta superfamily hydrolase